VEDDILATHGGHDDLVHVPNIGQPQGSLHGQEMVSKHRLSEFRHGKRIESPVDGMPALEGVVRRNQHRIRVVVHDAGQIALGEEVLEDLGAGLHVCQKGHQRTGLRLLDNGLHLCMCIRNVRLLQRLRVVVAAAGCTGKKWASQIIKLCY